MTESQPAHAFQEVIQTGPFPIRFPAGSALDQDEEWCEVKVDGVWQRIRFHDYSEVYAVPGLYETLFYRTLRCNSPNRVVSLLGEMLAEHGVAADALSVLDIGAGNGMVGEPLQALGIRRIHGVDIIPQAKLAAERDRPWVYNDYRVMDLTQMSERDRQWVRAFAPDVLTSVAALGYGDLPAKAFCNAFDELKLGGWLAFNIKEGFLRESTDHTGFSALVNRMTARNVIQMEAYKRYCHRLSIGGEPLYYIAVIARKLEALPADLLAAR